MLPRRVLSFVVLLALSGVFSSVKSQGVTCAGNCTLTPFTSAIPVYVGVMMININSLDVDASTIRFDFYVWIRWANCTAGPDGDAFRPDLTLEFDNAINRVDLTIRTFDDEPVCDSVPGYIYQQFRVEGQFLQDMDYRRYPLDSHRLELHIEDKFYPRDSLIYVPDDLRPASLLHTTVNLPGWSVGGFEIAEHPNTYATTWGSVSPLYTAKVYSNFEVSFTITRGASVYVLRVLPPVLVTILVIAIVFLLEIEETEARISVIAGGLLAMIFLQLTFGSNLPKSIDYLTIVDWLFDSMYFLILGVLIETVIIRWVFHILIRRDERAKKKVEASSVVLGGDLSINLPDLKMKNLGAGGGATDDDSDTDSAANNAGGGSGSSSDESSDTDSQKKKKKKKKKKGSSIASPPTPLNAAPRKRSLSTFTRKFKKSSRSVAEAKKRKHRMIHNILERVEKYVFLVFLVILCLDVVLVTVIARYA